MQRTIEEKNTQYPDRYYAGKWDGIWDKPKYQKIRDHILKSFEGLTFDEGPHKYYYKGKEFTPTSNVCHCFRIPFHEEEMAQHCEDKYFNDPVSKYFQMTTAQILESWHENSLRATTHGTKIHLFGENCSYFSMRQMDRLTDDFKARIETDKDGDVYVMPKEPKEEAVIKFWKDVPVCIVPLLFEVQMFDTEWEVSGTADLLFVYDPHLDRDDNEQELVTRLYLGDYKGLALDTPIFTTSGWKTMGTLEEDDVVYDMNGLPCKILNLSQIHYKPCYKLTFDNKETIIADSEHRWLVSFIRPYPNRRLIDKVMTTEEIATLLSKKNLTSYCIPKIKNAGPIQNDPIKLPIDPYVFGVWLGDGHKHSGHITNANKNVWEEIQKRGYILGEDVSQGGAGKAQTRNIINLVASLKELGVFKNKHLPNIYLLGSKEQRLDLLRGFMDTDGYYNKVRNRFVMDTTQEWQVDAIVKILGSLGIKPTVIKAKGYCNNCIKKKEFEKYNVTFYMEDSPFLVRKFKRGYKNKTKHLYKNIISVEKIETVPTRCIEVDSPTHTYLCGRNFTITHNTNGDLYKSFGNMLPPFEELPDNDLGGYKVQAGIYTHFLMNLGYKFVARTLIWLKDNGTYEKVKMESFTEILREYFKKHPIKQLLEERK